MKEKVTLVVALLSLLLVSCVNKPDLDIKVDESLHVYFVFTGEGASYLDNFDIFEINGENEITMWSILKDQDRVDDDFSGTLIYGNTNDEFKQIVQAKPLTVSNTYKVSTIRGDFIISWKFKLIKDEQTGKVRAIILDD